MEERRKYSDLGRKAEERERRDVRGEEERKLAGREGREGGRQGRQGRGVGTGRRVRGRSHRITNNLHVQVRGKHEVRVFTVSSGGEGRPCAWGRSRL